MTEQLVIVTGVAQLDAVLRTLEPKIQKKFTRKSLRNVGKLVMAAAKAIVQAEAYFTGTLYKAFKLRAVKRKRNAIGVSMFINREKLFANYTAEYGHPPNPRKGETEPHYYPASIEFGFTRPDGTEVPAIRPMRRALYDNAEAFKQFFANDLREIIQEAAIKGAAA